MKRFRGIVSAFCFLLCGSKVFADEVTFCVLDDFLQIVTFKGPDTECSSGFETPLEITSGEQGPQGPQGEEGEEGPAGPPGNPAPAGVTILSAGSRVNLSNSLSTYIDMFLENSNITESVVQHSLPISGALVGLNVVLSGTIGSAPNSYAFTVRSGGADTAITCTVAGPTATTCSSALCVDLAANTLIDVESTPNSGPTARTAWLYTTFRPGTTCAALGL